MSFKSTNPITNYFKSFSWKPYSRLVIVGDQANWAIDEEALELKRTAERIGLGPILSNQLPILHSPQIIHFSSQFSLLNPSIYRSNNKISVDYFHGKPNDGESYKKCFEAIRLNKSRISRIRVSTKDMQKEIIEKTQIDSEKIFLIPIGVNLSTFKQKKDSEEISSREKLGIPTDAFVIGSFQKDGIGWNGGDEPKLIKGPDVFIRVINRLKNDIPNLWVLLSGPSRNYVKNELDKINVPYVHSFADEYSEVSSYYDAIDLYLITSREEGGPKSCLESMAKGVPLVTTKVGQCRDIVKDGENALMTEIDDTENLYKKTLEIHRDQNLADKLTENGLLTAEKYSTETQTELWNHYFSSLI